MEAESAAQAGEGRRTAESQVLCLLLRHPGDSDPFAALKHLRASFHQQDTKHRPHRKDERVLFARAQEPPCLDRGISYSAASDRCLTDAWRTPGRRVVETKPQGLPQFSGTRLGRQHRAPTRQRSRHTWGLCFSSGCTAAPLGSAGTQRAQSTCLPQSTPLLLASMQTPLKNVIT